MKKQILFAAVLGIITLVSYTSADAQIGAPIAAEIPFEFYVGDKKMPAGEYLLEKLSPLTGQPVLSLRRKDGKAVTLLMPIPMTAKKKGDITFLFNRYGDDRYLSEIQNPHNGFGARLQQTKTEINLARQTGAARHTEVSLKSRSKQKNGTGTAASN